MQNETPDVKLLLLEHLRVLEEREQRRITIKEFAKRIGYDDKHFNHIYNKRRPLTLEHAERFARYFDDLRFYDAAGEPRPDENLFMVQAAWKKIPDSVKRKIREEIAPYLSDKNDD